VREWEKNEKEKSHHAHRLFEELGGGGLTVVVCTTVSSCPPGVSSKEVRRMEGRTVVVMS
jgi:hypothetical protein